MKKSRQLHLWIGLVTSFLILIEAVTGLFMIEPWLIGESKPSAGYRMHMERTALGETLEEGAWEGRKTVETEVNNNLMGFIRGLHAGRIGDTNLSIFLDIIAVGLIILTSTGIYLSFKTLRLQSVRRKN